ncbi:MAG: hypothetical protein PF574_09955 [Candidatus Delongbacteria bacterium]|jgi:tetratricopeptide (TPR) repeat protein|nr:hypothetical protein [Candidatus Delongbacteria bacterium]
MIKKSTLLLIVIFNCSLFGLDWIQDYEEGIKIATKQKKPVLFLYVSPKQKESLELSYVISKGHLDCLDDKFVMVQLIVDKPENSKRLKSLNMNQIPLFILQDFNPERKLSVNMLFIPPPQIFNALFEVYSTIGNQFMNIGDTQAARGAFELISGIPNEMGTQAKNAVKQIDNKNKKGNSDSKEEKAKTAKSFFDKASISVKNGNFDKAYLYLQKAIDAAPKSKIAEKAKLEMDNILPKVDKSKFLKTKDTKGSKK